jgi:hypothetical protein
MQPIIAHLDQRQISPDRSIQKQHKPAKPILERPSGLLHGNIQDRVDVNRLPGFSA